MVDLKTQYLKIENEIDEAIKEVILDSSFINGPSVKKFTSQLEEYLDVKHVIPCGNGTDALYLVLKAFNIGKGDEVITTPFTFIATTASIATAGAKPVFADVKEDYNIDENKIEKLMTRRSQRNSCKLRTRSFERA